MEYYVKILQQKTIQRDLIEAGYGILRKAFDETYEVDKLIEESQTDLAAVRAARQRLTLLRYQLAEKAEQGSFTYIIDDFTIYHDAGDFKCPDAARMFQEWTELKRQYESDLARLNGQRDEYADALPTQKQRMTSQLLELEEKVLQTEQRIIRMENEIRTTEINYLNR